MQAYSEQEYAELLAAAGLRLPAPYESLTGKADGRGFAVLLAVSAAP